jgi:hypothetical protein
MRPPIDGNGSSFETVSALALMAADTVKVRIGCLVFCVNYRQLAEAGNSADRRDSTAHSSQRLGLRAIALFAIRHRLFLPRRRYEYALPVSVDL